MAEDPSKVGKRSKRKGNTYERRVARLLTDLTDVPFRRVPGSGGFNKSGPLLEGKLFSGDVVCDREYKFKFSIEAKNRQSFSFIKSLSNPSSKGFSNWCGSISEQGCWSPVRVSCPPDGALQHCGRRTPEPPLGP